MPNWKKVAVSGSSPEFNNITASGHIDITGAGSSPLTDGVRLGVQSDKLQIYTDNGYVSIGPANSGFSHFYTDRTKFYFNKQVIVDSGFVSSYNEDLTLRRNYSSSDNEITLGHNMMSMSQGGNVVFTMNAGNITSSGNISASGTIEANGDFIVNSIGRVGINTTSPDYKLDVAGNVGINQYIYHNGDDDTYLRYQTDQLDLSAGGNVATLNANGFSINHITASGNISSSNQIISKHLILPTTDGTSIGGGGLCFGTPGNDHGHIYDDGTNLTLGYNDFDAIKIHDTGTILEVEGSTIIDGNLKTTSHITASGNISSSGNILGNFIVSNGIAIGRYNGTTTFLAADTKPTEIQGTNIELDAPVTASGNISSSGDLQSSKLTIIKKGASSNEKLISLTGGAGSEKFSVDEDGDVVGNTISNGTLTINGSTITRGGDTFFQIAAGGLFYEAEAGSIISFNQNQTAQSFFINTTNEEYSFAITGSTGAVGLGYDVDNIAGKNAKLAVNGNVFVNTHITSSGNITASGNLYLEGFISASGDISSSGTGNFGTLKQDGVGVLTTGNHTRVVSLAESATQGQFSYGYIQNGSSFNDSSFEIRGLQTDDKPLFAAVSASGNISASGELISSSSIKLGLDKLVTYDSTTGKYHTTASSAFLGGGSGGSGISNVVEDTTPQLGGDLDLNSKDITGTGHIGIDGSITASGDISASGNLYLEGFVSASGDLYIDGVISASGNIRGESYSSNGVLVIDAHNGDTTRVGTNSTTTKLLLGKAGNNQSITATGDITASNNISASNSIYAKKYYGTDDDSYMQFVDDAFYIRAGSDTIRFIQSSASTQINLPLKVLSHITSSGNISGSDGNILGFKSASFSHLETTGDISASGDLYVDDITVDAIKFIDGNGSLTGTAAGGMQFVNPSGPATLTVGSHITASGDISASSTSTGSFGYLQVGGIDYLGNPNTLPQINEGTADSSANQDKIILWDESADTWGYMTLDDLQDEIDTTGGGGGGGSMDDLVDDTTPQLGGDLDLNSKDITGTGHIGITGAITASGDISSSGNIISTQTGSFGDLEVEGSGTAILYVDGNITASGHIDLDGSVTASAYTNAGRTFNVTQNGLSTNGVNTLLNTANDDVYLQVRGSTDNNLLQVNPGADDKIGIGCGAPSEKLTLQSGNLLVSGGFSSTLHSHAAITTSIQPTLGKAYGDIVQVGGTDTTQGQIYALTSTEEWQLIDADGAQANAAVSSSLLGVALGTNSSGSGMLLRGYCQVSQSKTQVAGQAIYASTNPGVITGSVLGHATGDVIRVLGYALNAGASNASASIYFNPDSTWVTVA